MTLASATNIYRRRARAGREICAELLRQDRRRVAGMRVVTRTECDMVRLECFGGRANRISGEWMWVMREKTSQVCSRS